MPDTSSSSQTCRPSGGVRSTGWLATEERVQKVFSALAPKDPISEDGQKLLVSRRLLVNS